MGGKEGSEWESEWERIKGGGWGSWGGGRMYVYVCMCIAINEQRAQLKLQTLVLFHLISSHLTANPPYHFTYLTKPTPSL